MRSDLARRVGFWGAALVCLGTPFWILHSNQTLAAEAGAMLQQRLDTAQPIRTFDTEGGDVYQLKTTNDLIVFLLWKEDSSVVVAYGRDGKQRFRFGLADGEFRRLLAVDLSSDGSTLLIAEALAFESLNWRVFDTSGALRCSIRSEVDILTSPRGKLFCTRDTDPSPEKLSVYDSLGREVKRYDDVSGGWNCQFVNNDRLVVVTTDSVKLVDAVSGQGIFAVSIGRNPKRLHPPALCVSPSCSLLAVYNSNLTGGWIRLITSTGETKWETSYSDYLCSVAFSGDERWLALRFGNPGVPTGYVRVISADDPSVTARSEDVGTLGYAVFVGYRDDLQFSDGLISVPAPPQAGPGVDPNAAAVTIFLEFDIATRSVSSPATMQGLYFPVPDTSVTARFVCAKPGAAATLISIPRE